MNEFDEQPTAAAGPDDASGQAPDAAPVAEPQPAVIEPRAEAAESDLPAADALAADAVAPEQAESEPDATEAYVPPSEPLRPQPTGERHWYILKVQSNREDSIREALLRNIKIHGLEDFFGDVVVPVEMVTEFKNGKKRVMKRKLYPGYLIVNMELNDDTWFLVRDTHGIGDFTGAGGKPTPMHPHEVSRIIVKHEEKADEAPKLKIAFNKGDRIKINDGTFENFEGDVDSIDAANGRVTVMINIFGRSTPVELEYWQLESI